MKRLVESPDLVKSFMNVDMIGIGGTNNETTVGRDKLCQLAEQLLGFIHMLKHILAGDNIVTIF